ncbi:hypothetical protein, partial [Acidaminococcus fermentans]|uniref:hypothetical protein n=1 Tax=Acidaminococcus fermentans TaxID=905 RepID=UPI00243207D3
GHFFPALWVNYSPALTDDKNYLFSLYPNDLIYVESRSKINFKLTQDKEKESTLEPEFSCSKILGYYQGCDVANGAINIITPDGTYLKHNQGVKRLKRFEKYQVDILGKSYPVKSEVRRKIIIKQKAR